MTETVASCTNRFRWKWAAYWVAALLGVFTYISGLDSDHIPKNGDEFVYLNIARLTAQSGHWLPLQAGDAEMRNTKPPLLLWQGITSSHWGRDWARWRLRYPSVVYTLLTSLMVFLLGRRLTRRPETGFVAFLVFLGFFSTYRYGRPYLTDAPVVFWLFLPLFVLLYWQPKASESRWVVPLTLGLGLGIGLLYKSFALLVPVALCLAWWYSHRRDHQLSQFLRLDAGKIAIMAVISLALFSLWFLLDPEPQAIWRGFVLGENLTKFNSGRGGYVQGLLWGGSSIWRLAVSYPLNAGLLAFPVVVLFWVAFKRRRQTDEAEKVLWVWIVALFLFFSLPSQRDERYLLPGMPALAVLCALNWQQINRKAFAASLIVTGIGAAVLAYLSVRLQRGMPDVQLFPPAYWLLLTGVVLLVALGLWRPSLTRIGTAVAALLFLLSFSSFMGPLDGPVGVYDARAQQYAVGKEVWVPINFRAKEEGYRFFLPGAEVRGYRSDGASTVADLGARYHLFVASLPVESAPPAGFKVIGQRLDIGSRHSSGQIMEMMRGKVFEHLFRREFLLEVP
jgi:4-amino-4-deoxy-L-arabinose transferase-like glycosyltransferase